MIKWEVEARLKKEFAEKGIINTINDYLAFPLPYKTELERLTFTIYLDLLKFNKDDIKRRKISRDYFPHSGYKRTRGIAWRFDYK